MKYSSELKKIFAEEVVEPSPEIVKYFTKQVYDGVITAKVQEQFSALVKRAISSYINEQISNRLKTALNNEEQRDAIPSANQMPEEQSTSVVEDSDNGKIVTTQEELDGFMIVKAMVRKIVDIERVVYRDAQSYFAILLDDNNRKPVCRLYFNSKSKKYISTFDKDKKEEKHEITDLNDIFNFEKELCEVIKVYDEK